MAEEDNNFVDLTNLSIEQINEMYSDIIEFPDSVLIASCNAKHGHVCAELGRGQ